MLTKEVIERIEKLAPRYLEDNWDNSGLQIGYMNRKVTKILIALDISHEVIDKAIKKNCNVILTHHPLFFKDIKSIDLNTSKGKLIEKIIKNDISIYSAHSTLDKSEYGMNYILEKKLNIKDSRVISQDYFEKYCKLVIFAPGKYANIIREELAKEKAGCIGEYDNCSFSSYGEGRFRPLEGTDPFIGKSEDIEVVEEVRVESICDRMDVERIVEKVKKVHPYEEVAYDIYPLENKDSAGYGVIGNLEKIDNLKGLSNKIKMSFGSKSLRVYGDLKKPIRRIAVCSGSGSFLIEKAKLMGADVYITGDLKYHDIQTGVENELALVDIGHFESESIVLDYIKEYLENNLNEKIDIIVDKNNIGKYTII